jgi:hypothetical protein
LTNALRHIGARARRRYFETAKRRVWKGQ